MSFVDLNGREVVLGKVLGEGGEGTVHAIEGHRSLVAKVYHRNLRTPEREAKIKQMLIAPPIDPLAARGKVSLAWPKSALFEDRAFAGFTMPAVDISRAYALHQLWKAKQRPRGCTYSHLTQIASNLCAVTQALHTASYVLGDVNESNFLVTDRSLVVAVDLDSIQVPAADGTTHRCVVHKPEFSPPELQGGFDFRAQDRMPEHDLFGLGILVWELLMLGRHPFAGGKPQIATNIQDGSSWALDASRPAPAGAPPLEVMPPELIPLARRAFGTDPAARSEGFEWHRTLAKVIDGLKKCKKVKGHSYGGHLSACPWCAYADRWRYDPFDPSSTKAAYGRSREGNRKLAQEWSKAKSDALQRKLGGRRAPAQPIPATPSISLGATSSQSLPTVPGTIDQHLPTSTLPHHKVPAAYEPRRIPTWWWWTAFGVCVLIVGALLALPGGGG